MPRSYLLWEPAVQRGFRNGWDAKRQMIDRLNSLYNCGNQVDMTRISDDQKVAFRGSKDMEFNWNLSFPLEPRT